MTNAIIAALTVIIWIQLTLINWALQRIADALEKQSEETDMRDATKEEQESVDNYITSISTTTIPLSVIEDIKADIKAEITSGKNRGYDEWADGNDDGLKLAYKIIDKYTSRKENKC